MAGQLVAIVFGLLALEPRRTPARRGTTCRGCSDAAAVATAVAAIRPLPPSRGCRFAEECLRGPFTVSKSRIPRKNHPSFGDAVSPFQCGAEGHDTYVRGIEESQLQELGLVGCYVALSLPLIGLLIFLVEIFLLGFSAFFLQLPKGQFFLREVRAVHLPYTAQQLKS